MRAIQIHQWTRPEDLRETDAPGPSCGVGEVVIDVHAAAISHSLGLLVQGQYQRKPAFPFIPGNTVAGIVSATGEGATRFRIGDRVVASLEMGGLAAQAAAHEDNVFAIPEGMPFDEATTLNTSYNSVAAALTWPHVLNLQAGQALLVTGAGGGTGTAAVQIGKLLGARVMAAARSDARRQRALRHGAEWAVDADPATLRDAVREHLPEGVDAAIEPAGGALFDAALRCMAPMGRIVPLGFAGGDVPQIPANLLLVKNITVCGLYMGYYKIDARAEHAGRMRALFTTLGDWWSQGLIRPEIGLRLPLAEVSNGFAWLRERAHTGHAVIDMAAH